MCSPCAQVRTCIAVAQVTQVAMAAPVPMQMAPNGGTAMSFKEFGASTNGCFYQQCLPCCNCHHIKFAADKSSYKQGCGLCGCCCLVPAGWPMGTWKHADNDATATYVLLTSDPRRSYMDVWESPSRFRRFGKSMDATGIPPEGQLFLKCC